MIAKMSEDERQRMNIQRMPAQTQLTEVPKLKIVSEKPLPTPSNSTRKGKKDYADEGYTIVDAKVA